MSDPVTQHDTDNTLDDHDSLPDHDTLPDHDALSDNDTLVDNDSSTDSGCRILRFPSNTRPSNTRVNAPVDHEQPRLRDVVGDVVRDERRRQDRTLADVAADAAVSLPYLSEVERGTKDVSSDVLAAISRSLDLPLADLLDRCADRLRGRAQRGVDIELRAA